MPGSTVSLQHVLDDSFRFGDLKPVLGMSGSSMEPALTIGTIVMAEMCSRRFDFKWNSFNVPPFFTISWQNDYLVPGVTNLGWLQNGVLIDINNSQIPKRKFRMECVRDLQPTSDSFGRPFQCSWLNNTNLLYGSWGSGLSTPNSNVTGQTNPGPSVVYTYPIGGVTTPSNPTTQIIDTNGNLQYVNWTAMNPTSAQTFTCGLTQPAWPVASAAVGTSTTDGTVIWTVGDPYGQGFRLQMIPAQSGVVWMIMLRAQYKPVKFTSLGQMINPIPDDFSQYFMQGFRAYCYQRSPEARVNAKFNVEYQLWQQALLTAESQADRETESYGAYPSDDIQGGMEFPNPGPAWPFTPYS